MSVKKIREIVVEVERILLVKKRARTHQMFCIDCSQEADFVCSKDAARIFDIGEINISRFLKNNGWHTLTDRGRVYICTASLIADLAKKKNNSGPRQIS
jgi:hypothetical protein